MIFNKSYFILPALLIVWRAAEVLAATPEGEVKGSISNETLSNETLSNGKGLLGRLKLPRRNSTFLKDLSGLFKWPNSNSTKRKERSLARKLCRQPLTLCNNDITIWYYSRSIKDGLKLNSSKSISNTIRPNNSPWKVIIHGNPKSDDDIQPTEEIISAYLKQGEYNLLSVDFTPLTKDICYISTEHSVPLIAKCTAEMIDQLVDNNFFSSSILHVIGFDLGAHIGGNLYKHLRHNKPQRVTGLDPPMSIIDAEEFSLSKKSARFVDVIHTNADGFGSVKRLGHVDFYVNGGYSQPGCNQPLTTCSHNRAAAYYAESIKSKKGFWAVACPNHLNYYSGLCDVENESDLVPMGEYTPFSMKGTYYLQTSDLMPFALGKKVRVKPN